MAYLCTEKKFLHIHIPKTAGTSVRKILGGGGHQTALDFHEFVSKGTDLNWDDFFKFTVVRDPWTRFISGAFHGPTPEYNPDKVLDELLEKSRNNSWERRANIFHPQWMFTHAANGQFSKGMGFMDYIGRFEELDRAWQDICKILGIEKKLPHANRGTYHKDWQTPERLDKVKEIYSKDYELFYPERR